MSAVDPPSAPRAGLSWMMGALLIAVGCSCGSDEPTASRPDGAQGTEKDGGLTVRRDASSGTSLPRVDARVVLPIEDPGVSGDAAVGPSAQPSTRDAAVADAGMRKICGGLAGIACKDDEFCSQEDNASGVGCGFPDSTGVCTPRDRVCDPLEAPVCGCDSKTYGSDCESHRAGVSIAKRGACTNGQNVSCDDRKVTCKRTRPMCPEFQVPAVDVNCWGDCVAIDQCVCTEADACPERDTYVCHMSAGHCGPYVN